MVQETKERLLIFPRGFREGFQNPMGKNSFFVEGCLPALLFFCVLRFVNEKWLKTIGPISYGSSEGRGIV